MKRRALLGSGLAAALAPPARAQGLPPQALLQPGRLLMLRHAQAPGSGDPSQFKLGDCSTQRNLDHEGRAQARTLGARLAAAGVRPAALHSSQWCRCLETARLLGLGPVRELPLLNSFFNREAERAPRIVALRHFIATLPADGAAVVLVTHQFTISEFTGQGMASGQGAVFQLDGSTMPAFAGVLQV